MKVWVVVNSREDESGYAIVGVHQVEQYAVDQANELMAHGEWSAPLTYESGVSTIKEFTRDGDVVSIEEIEVRY